MVMADVRMAMEKIFGGGVDGNSDEGERRCQNRASWVQNDERGINFRRWRRTSTSDNVMYYIGFFPRWIYQVLTYQSNKNITPVMYATRIAGYTKWT